MERKNYNAGMGSRTETQIGFTASFRSEYDGWRKKRPQWLALCKAIRNELPREQIYAAAADAGATFPEVSDMRTLFHNGRRDAAEAKKLDSVEKALAAAEKRLAKALKQMDKGGLSVNDQDAAREEYEAAFFAHDRAKMDVIGPRSAVATVALAKSENLL